MSKYYTFLFILWIGHFASSQEVSEECSPPSKKIIKTINAAKKAKDSRSAVLKFKEAIEANESNAMAYYEYALYTYKKALRLYKSNPNPAMGNRSFHTAAKMFEETINLCAEYHSNCYYYLGLIRYSLGDDVGAVEWFKQFISYNHSDAEKYANDHNQRLKDAVEVVENLEYTNKVKTETVPFAPIKVKNVSTGTDEYFPMISPDNELIYYTRKNRIGGPGVKTAIREQFTCSVRPNIHSEFDGGSVLPPPFNQSDITSYGASTMSVDNKELIICACKMEKVGVQDYKNCDLYSSTYSFGGRDGSTLVWSPLKNLGDHINTPTGWEGQPSLSADGKTLYYTANRASTRDNDIFVVKRDENGEWGNAQPFDVVNTDGKDKSPFLHQDSETLYFVSESTKERPGVGGLDIFFIRQDENGNWSKPKNIGYPINSEKDELGIFVSIDGKEAYFSSRISGNWNIYSFDLYEEARPQSVALLTGNLEDENGAPVSDAKIEIAYEGTDVTTTVNVNGNDGKYAAIVKMKKPQDVMVTVVKEGHAFDSKLISKNQMNEGDLTIRGNNLSVKKLELGASYTINDILFATNSAELNGKSKFILKGFARFLKQNESIQVSINGHTDDVGDANENMELSKSRADGVRKYLLSLGIDQERLESNGYGETRPKLDNDTPQNRAQNRRTDFVITGM